MDDGSTKAQAELILPSTDLPADMAFFETHGFRLDQILPADNPSVARLSGHGLRLCIDQNTVCEPPTIRLDINLAPGGHRHPLQAPNGTTLVFGEQPETMPIPTNHPFEVTRQANADKQVTGRAGMLYRDLIPSRFGGQMIASHISIPVGGPVNDMVHFHEVEFQLIYCYRGWVKVVYEDQGEPLILNPGDCVTQPPGIRHRVLESSDNLEVIEIGVPAIHMTNIDHELELPTSAFLPERVFGGQRFCHHVADRVPWLIDHEDKNNTDFKARETGVQAASRGVASVRALRPVEPTTSNEHTMGLHKWRDQPEVLAFYFVMEGGFNLLTVDKDEHTTTHELARCDSFTFPRGQQYCFRDLSNDLVLLEVLLHTSTNAA